jgi:hypothetical protein
MTTAIYFAKTMVRKAREITIFECKVCDAIEFLVLMTLPFVLPIFIISMSVKGY